MESFARDTMLQVHASVALSLANTHQEPGTLIAGIQFRAFAPPICCKQ
jgi:hypothetical protein